jgi:hypothetical protein
MGKHKLNGKYHLHGYLKLFDKTTCNNVRYVDYQQNAEKNRNVFYDTIKVSRHLKKKITWYLRGHTSVHIPDFAPTGNGYNSFFSSFSGCHIFLKF